MKVSVKTITPAQAKKLLERNTNNRPVSKPHVKFLCGVIRRGEWKLNGDAIRFNSERLVDGQHRLAACIETDRKSTRLNSSHSQQSRMPSSA